jgi:hypothetical protein
MTVTQLLLPEHVEQVLAKRYANAHRLWITGKGQWPFRVTLGNPTETDMRGHSDLFRKWILAWNDWSGVGRLEWRERQWKTIGTQRLPKAILLDNPSEVAKWIGRADHWRQARERYECLTSRWPMLCDYLICVLPVISEYGEQDFCSIMRLLEWLEANPNSNLYPRQIPVAGVDSKCLERHKGVIAELLSLIQGTSPTELDFYQRCGLKAPPKQMRLRLLDRELRKIVGGLSDFAASPAELAQLSLDVRQLFVVENLQTGLAFEALPGAAVLMGLGYSVEGIVELPWATTARCTYWGDIDTHGFSILSRVRAYLPHVESMLMDEQTLLDHQALWCEEERPHSASELPGLTDEEQAVFGNLKQNRWGVRVRLEQERIPWDYAWRVICHHNCG